MNSCCQFKCTTKQIKCKSKQVFILDLNVEKANENNQRTYFSLWCLYDSIAKVENTLWKGWTEHQDSFHGHKPESGESIHIIKGCRLIFKYGRSIGRTFCGDNGSFLFLGIVVWLLVVLYCISPSSPYSWFHFGSICVFALESVICKLCIVGDGGHG